MSTAPPQARPGHDARFRLTVVLPVLLLALLWAAWPPLSEMAKTWSHDPRYSHGWLVPAFSGFLLWHRRGLIADGVGRPSWWGLALIVFGEATRLAGARFHYTWFEGLGLVPTLAGVCLLVGGWKALRWAAPAVGFLVFMVPLPYVVEHALGQELQKVATYASNYTLQTLGLPAVSEGNIIHIDDKRIGVVDACNGLGMLFMFLAFAVGATLVLDRPWWVNALIVVSAVPIALFANVTRIVTTGLLYALLPDNPHIGETFYHDLAGWLMMPVALGALWLELFLISKLFVEIEVAPPVPIGLTTMGVELPLARGGPERRAPRPPGTRPDRPGKKPL